MKNNSGTGCFLIILLIIIVILPFKLGLDFLEKNDMCYKYIPFCESKQEKEEKMLEQAETNMYRAVEKLSENSGVNKWMRITTYRAKNGGFIYYLGTNSMNGIYLYWDGSIENYKLSSLDYQAQDKLRVGIYDGEERLDLIHEFLNSEEAQRLNE